MSMESIDKALLFERIGLHLLVKSEDGYLMVSPKGDILFCNESMCTYIGLPEHDIIGSDVRKLLREYRIFDIMRIEEDSRNTRGLIPHFRQTEGTPDSNVHLVSRYPITDSQGMVIAGLIHIRFRSELQKQNSMLNGSGSTEQPTKNDNSVDKVEVIGNSASFIKAKNMAIRCGNNQFPILITGETGVGKEIIAGLIQSSSRRKNKPFVKINCAAIPADLLESELFGYDPGAFTGANKAGKKGKFEIANGGTIFLDEIGDMPISMQVKLLRVLQEKELEHVGGSKPIPVDVRVISATRLDLEQKITRGEFREDLYYRLNVINIKLDPLRERKDDILPLAEHFLKRLNQAYAADIILPDNAESILLSYDWPGNIRELNNVIQHSFALTDGNVLNLNSFRMSHAAKRHLGADNIPDRSLQEMMNEFEKTILSDVIKACGYNLTVTAAKLGMPRSSLYNKIKKYNISIRE